MGLGTVGVVSGLIDTHTHAVSPDADRFPQRAASLPNGAWWTNGDVSIEGLAAAVEASSVDGVVLVQAAGPYGDDNSYLVEAVADQAVFAGVCIVDPVAPGATDRLRTLADNSRIDGIRLFHVPTPANPWLASTAANELLDLAAELGLTVTVCCMADALSDLGRQLSRRPDLAVVLDHCGFADFSGTAPYPEAQPLWNLARYEQLHVKFTPTLARHDSADPVVLAEQLVTRFGGGRIVWGSDWPQHRETSTYGEQVDLVQSWFAGCDADVRSAIGGQNALRLWPRSWPHLLNP